MEFWFKSSKIFILIFILSPYSLIFSQTSNTPEEKEALKTIEKIITNIQNKNIENLKLNSINKIYCQICFEKITSKQKPEILKEEFYKDYFSKIFNDRMLTKLNNNSKKIILKQDSKYSNYVVLITIDEPNEIARGHEGSQFGIWLKKKRGNFYISGFETIP